MPTYRINVANKCSENWNEMKPDANGKFCFNCQKNVIDFTAKSEKEIVAYLLQNKNSCGRFFKEHLNKEIIYTPFKPTQRYWPTIAALLLTGLFSVAPSFSQTENQKKLHKPSLRTEPITNIIYSPAEVLNIDSPSKEKKEFASLAFIRITGNVINQEDSTPVRYANVLIEIDSVQITACQTDSLGAFSFAPIKFEPNQQVILYVKVVGYSNYSVILKEEEVVRPLLIVLEEREAIMGLINITIEKKTLIPDGGRGQYYFNAPGFN